MDDSTLMRRSIVLSEKTFEKLDTPVGCVITRNGEIKNLLSFLHSTPLPQ